MTTQSVHHEPVSVKAPENPRPSLTIPVPEPGPMSVFVVLIAIAVGLAGAFAFKLVNPETRLIILGGTLVCAAVMAIIGLYRFSWFLYGVLALRPALDDLVADEFGSFQPSAILGILAIAVSALHLISRRTSGNWHRLTPIGWAMIAFFIGFVPSFVLSVDRGVSQAAMFGLASVVLLYLACEQLLQDNFENIWRLALAAGVGLIVPVVTGFVQFFWTGTLDPGGSGLIRIDGSFAHPNPYATYLVFAVLFAVGIAPTLSVEKKMWTLILASLCSFLLVATFARGAWASFILGSLLMAARINKKLVVVILLAAVGVAGAVPGVGDRLGNLFETTSATGGVKTDDSLGWRIGYWEKVWSFRTHNPLFGLGIDATKTQTIEAKDPHNSFLQAFVEGGIVGGLAFVTLFIIVIVASVRVWRRVKRGRLDRRTSLLAIGAVSALFSVSAQLITENVLLNTIVWWYMNIALALLAVLNWGRTRAFDAAPPSSRLELPAGGETRSYAGAAGTKIPVRS